MKKFAKIWLYISLLSIAFGVVIVIAAMIAGSRWRTPIDTISLKETYDNVESLNFNFNYGRVYIKEGDSFSISAENVPETAFNSYVSNGVWYIKEKYGILINVFGKSIRIDRWFDWDFEKNARTITVTLPKDFIANECNLTIGAGEVDIEAINAKKGTFSVGAGKVNIDKLSITEKSDYEVGAGSMYINKISAVNTEIECGIGEISISGELKGYNNIQCGIGHIKININGHESDYSYDLEAGLGNIVINNRRYHGMNTSINNNTDNRLELECGIGSIEIDFY